MNSSVAVIAGSCTWRQPAGSAKVPIGRNAMELGRSMLAATLCVSGMLWASAASAQDVSAGRDIVIGKCFQCHTDAMFRDQRQERRGWEATIYRMIGRGGLFTPEEIKLMADYLATDFGPNEKPAAK
jgi:mono/diheme cytochrome c family protein